jgi:hypothetical protein
VKSNRAQFVYRAPVKAPPDGDFSRQLHSGRAAFLGPVTSIHARMVALARLPGKWENGRFCAVFLAAHTVIFAAVL